LIYDRLGTGKSEKPDAYKIIQAPVEVEIIKGVVESARAGSLLSKANASLPSISVPSFTKIVVVGHSYGSILTSGFISKYGSLVDGAVLTGFILNKYFGTTQQGAFDWQYAPSSDDKRSAHHPSGYLTQGSSSSVQRGFFRKGSFEPEILAYADSIKQTITVGELISAGTVLGSPALEFGGPLMVSPVFY
jgi:pimeloyl-ACP methyl ester carboxylesterase